MPLTVSAITTAGLQGAWGYRGTKETVESFPHSEHSEPPFLPFFFFFFFAFLLSHVCIGVTRELLLCARDQGTYKDRKVELPSMSSEDRQLESAMKVKVA